MSFIEQTFRLTNEPGGMGLSCTPDGLSLAGVPLLYKTAVGFAVRPAHEICALIEAAYGPTASAIRLLPSLDIIAAALNRGDIAHAVTAAVLTQPLELAWSKAASIAKVEEALSKYNSDEARDHRGRWTAGSDRNAGVPQRSAATSVVLNANSGQGTTVHSAGRWPDIHRENPNIVPAQAGAVPLFPPPIIGGTARSPKPKDDDFIFPAPVIPQTNAGQAGTSTTDTPTANDNNPRTCPDPSFEVGSGSRTPGQLHYQAQISGLPLGVGVELNGVQFDGCRESDGTMLEAKTTGPWFFKMPDFVFRLTNEYRKTVDQAVRQIYASGSRKIEWHFSNPRVADFWREEFASRGYKITVKYTPFMPVTVKFFFLSDYPSMSAELEPHQ